eukprot:5190766-Pyramimonas_sp.AAC.2
MAGGPVAPSELLIALHNLDPAKTPGLALKKVTRVLRSVNPPQSSPLRRRHVASTPRRLSLEKGTCSVYTLQTSPLRRRHVASTHCRLPLEKATCSVYPPQTLP